MQLSPFEVRDLKFLYELQPPDWGDLIPRFQYFINSAHCKPIKISENNVMVAIGTSMLHEDTAWLACIIVHPNYRNKGLGNTVTKALIDAIDRDKFQTIYLDATDFGYPVYKKLGFEVETEYVHLRRENISQPSPISENIIPFHDEFKEQILSLDSRVSGENRRGILSDFLNSAKIYLNENEVQGYYIPDWGDGPIIGGNEIAGLELMKLRSSEKDIAILPSANLVALDFLKENKFETYKTSKRMFLGKRRAWNPNGVYNRISGQLG